VIDQIKDIVKLFIDLTISYRERNSTDKGISLDFDCNSYSD
jgi:hypothetical protein